MKKVLHFFAFINLVFCQQVYAHTFSNCLPPSSSIQLDVSNIRATLFNAGDKFGGYSISGSIGYEVPKGSGKHSMSTSGIWLSAHDEGGNLHTAAQQFRIDGTEFWSGRIKDDGTVDSLICASEDKMYEVYGAEIVAAKTGKEVSYNISRWANSFAPFFDSNSDGIYDPSKGDYPTYNKSKPDLIPAQMVWYVCHDLGKLSSSLNRNPLGVQVEVVAAAFTSSSSEAINNTTLYRYEIQNKSVNNYPVFRFGEWADYGVGDVFDDYVGCDLSTNSNGKKRNLSYCYNSDDVDDGSSNTYGSGPPAIGVMFLNTGQKADGTNYELAAHFCQNFLTLHGQGMPGWSGQAIDNFLKGNFSFGAAVNYGGVGQNSTFAYPFMFPGDTGPAGSEPWYDSFPRGERQATLSLEPRSFAAGEKIIIELAYLWARDSLAGNVGSLEKLKRSADTLITAYENFFRDFSVGVQKSKLGSFLIFPNPAENYIELRNSVIGEEISIYDLQGKRILLDILAPSKRIDVSTLSPGVYIVKNNQGSCRFVKNVQQQ